MNPVTSQSEQGECRITPLHLREAIDALREAAETRRNLCESEAPDNAIHHAIAESYERTARTLDHILRVLERDQAIQQPLAPSPAVTIATERPVAVKPTCARRGSENASADAAARWNQDTQDWEVSGDFDKGNYCDDCENIDVPLIWVELQPDRR